MNVNDIKSAVVADIISGSPTPALDLVALIGAGKLSQTEKNEIHDYYFSRGGLHKCATWEHNKMIEMDI